MGKTYRQVPAWWPLYYDWLDARKKAGDDPLVQLFVPPKPDMHGSNWPSTDLPDEDWPGFHMDPDRRRAETRGWRRRNKVRVQKGLEPEPHPRTGSWYRLGY